MRQWLRNLSIKAKLTVIILAVSLLLVILISVALITNERIRLEQNIAEDLQALTDIMGATSGIGLEFDDVTFENFATVDVSAIDLLKNSR